jgi:hypothetical protein
MSPIGARSRQRGSLRASARTPQGWHVPRTGRDKPAAPRLVYNIYSVVSALFRDAKLGEPIVGIPGFETIDVTGKLEVITTARLVDPPTCPRCQSEGPHRRKDLVPRKIRHASIGARGHWLVVQVPKWRCR